MKSVYSLNLYLYNFHLDYPYPTNPVLFINLTKIYGVSGVYNVSVCKGLPCNSNNILPFCYYHKDGSCDTTPSDVIVVKYPGVSVAAGNIYIYVGNEIKSTAVDPKYVFGGVIENFVPGTINTVLLNIGHAYMGIGSIYCPYLCRIDFGYSTGAITIYTIAYSTSSTDLEVYDLSTGYVGAVIASSPSYIKNYYTPIKIDLHYNINWLLYYNDNNVVIFNNAALNYFGVNPPQTNIRFVSFYVKFFGWYNRTLLDYYYKYTFYYTYNTNLKQVNYLYTNILNISFTPKTHYGIYRYYENYNISIYLDGNLIYTINNTSSIYYTIQLNDLISNHTITIQFSGINTKLTKKVTFTLVPKYYELVSHDQKCYTSPCNLSIVYRCGIFNYTNSTIIPYYSKIYSTYNISPVDIVCDNITRSINIEVNLSKFNNQTLSVTFKLYSPISNILVDKKTINISTILYSFKNYITNYTYVYNKTYYGKYIKIINKVRCGILGNKIHVVSGISSNYSIYNITCDNRTHYINLTATNLTKVEGIYETIFRLYNISNFILFNKTYAIGIDYNKPVAYIVYQTNPNGTVLLSINAIDHISPYLFCTLKISNKTKFYNKVFFNNKIYSFLFLLNYGVNRIFLSCYDSGYNIYNQSVNINIMPNLLISFNYLYPQYCYVNRTAKVTINIDVYNTGNYYLYKNITYDIPIMYAYNVSIIDKSNRKLIYYKDKLFNSIPININDIPPGGFKEYQVSFDIPTVYILNYRKYFIIENGIRYDVYDINFISKSPYILNNVYYTKHVNCSNFYKAVVNNIEANSICYHNYLKINLGTFTPNQEKNIKIYFLHNNGRIMIEKNIISMNNILNNTKYLFNILNNIINIIVKYINIIFNYKISLPI